MSKPRYETVNIVPTQKHKNYKYKCQKIEQPIYADNAQDVLDVIKGLHPNAIVLGRPDATIRCDIRHLIKNGPEYLLLIGTKHDPAYLGIKSV